MKVLKALLCPQLVFLQILYFLRQLRRQQCHPLSQLHKTMDASFSLVCRQYRDGLFVPMEDLAQQHHTVLELMNIDRPLNENPNRGQRLPLTRETPACA